MRTEIVKHAKYGGTNKQTIYQASVKKRYSDYLHNTDGGHGASDARWEKEKAKEPAMWMRNSLQSDHQHKVVL